VALLELLVLLSGPAKRLHARRLSERVPFVTSQACCRVYGDACPALQLLALIDSLELKGEQWRCHRPHPGKEAKRYQVEEARELLERAGVKP
jgi:hypothetical protein